MEDILPQLVDNAQERVFDDQATLFLSNDPSAHIATLSHLLLQPSQKKRLVISSGEAFKKHILHSLPFTAGIRFFSLQGCIEYLFSLYSGELLQLPSPELISLVITNILMSDEKTHPLITEYLAGEKVNMLDLSRTLAQVFFSFDRYGGSLEPWQQVLWQEITPHLFSLEKCISAPLDTSMLPVNGEIHIFLLSHIPEKMHLFFSRLAASWPVYYYLLSPSQYFWGDLASDRQRSLLQKQLRKKNVRQEMCDDYDLYARDRNPLLANLGTLTSEFFLRLVEQEKISCEYYQHRNDGSILGQIQEDILQLQRPEKVDSQNHLGLHVNVSFHGAPSRLREVEILYNHISSLFAHDPSLSRKDILILAPHIDVYLPQIVMIFGHRESQLQDYEVSNLPICMGSSYFRDLQQLFRLSDRHLDVYEIFCLFRSPSFQRKFQIDENDVRIWETWAKEFHIQWGYSDQERQNILKDHGISLMGSWSYAFEQLLLGIVYSKEPYLDTKCVASLDILMSIIEQLHVDLQTLEKQSCTIEEWISIILDFTNKYLSPPLQEESFVSLFVRHVYALNDILPCYQETSIPFSTLWPYVREVFTKTSYTFRSSPNLPLHFARLSEENIVPIKHCFLLGLDEENFPHHSNIHSLFPKDHGEPSPPDRDRLSILLCLLHTRCSLTISYQNIHPEDGKTLHPSLIAQDLIEYIRIFYSIPKETYLFSHPASSLSLCYFAEDSKHKSYISRNYYLLQRRHTEQKHHQKHCLLRTISSPVTHWDVKDLAHISHHPLKYYVRRVLHIELSHNEPFTHREAEFVLSPLDKYKVQNYAMPLPIAHRLFADIALRDMEKRPATEAPQWQVTLHPHCTQPYRHTADHYVFPTLVLEDGSAICGTIRPFSLISPKDYCKHWTNLLILNILCPHLLEEKERVQHSEQSLKAFVHYATEAVVSPPPFTANYFEKMVAGKSWENDLRQTRDPYVHFFQEPWKEIDKWLDKLRQGYDALIDKFTI